MKKALIYYLYGTKNAGDMAICVGAIELLKKQGYSITMVSRFSEAENEYNLSKQYIHEYFPDVKVYPGPFSFERDFAPMKKLTAYGASFAKVCGVLPDRKNAALIAEHDIVFFNGGNLLRGEKVTDYLRLVALFYPIELAKKAGKPVYCLPQSTAGISRLGKRLLRRYLRGIQAIYVREKISYEALRRQFPEMPFLLSTDLAFFCQDRTKAEENFHKQFGGLSDSGNVALILRNSGIGDIGRLDAETERTLLTVLETYVVQHPENAYWIVVQTLKDKEVSERFLAAVREKGKIRIVESHDPLVLRELYKHMDFTITMRLHAGILSLSALTPVVGLFSQCWGLKNPGIMASYDMPYQIIEQKTECIERLVAELPSDAPQKIQEKISTDRESIVIDEHERGPSMKTRVAIVLPCFSDGGAQVMIARLVSHLNPETVDAEVICICGKPQNNRMEQAVLNHGVPIRYIGKGKGFSGRAITALYRELSRFQPDVVHTHLSACVYCAPWVMAHKVKMLHTVHNMPEHELIQPKRAVMHLLYRRNDAVPVAISHEIQTMTKKFYGLKRQPERIDNPVDVERFSSLEKKKHDGYVVLNVGRISKQKNQRLLIEAFSQLLAKHDNAELYILGDGPDRQELQELVEKQGLTDHIHLEGSVEHVEEYYAKADVFALSSIYEGLPLVVLEAMAASLPIVSTDVGGVKDIVTDNGLLVESGNCEQLSHALITLLEDQETRQTMGARSFDHVQRFDSAIIASQYVDLYQKYSRKAKHSGTV